MDMPVCFDRRVWRAFISLSKFFLAITTEGYGRHGICKPAFQVADLPGVLRQQKDQNREYGCSFSQFWLLFGLLSDGTFLKRMHGLQPGLSLRDWYIRIH